MNSELGSKILRLIDLFEEDSEKFNSYYNLDISDVDNSHYNSLGRHGIDYHIAYDDRKFFYILTKKTPDRTNSRWIYKNEDTPSDIITYNHTTMDKTVHFTRQMEMYLTFDFSDISLFTEEYLFQKSLVMDKDSYDTLEMFLYLEIHSNKTFQVNLAMFDIDEALEIYK